MKLYLIRHGQTDFNKEGIVQGGGVDSDLNAQGRQQAQAFFDYYQHLHFDALYASDLKRTHQTVAPWVKEKGYPLQIAPEIREFSWGWMEGKRPDASDKRQFIALKEAWAKGDFTQGIEGGDSPQEFWDRLEPFLKQLAEKHNGQTVLACSHGRTSRILLSQLLGKGMQAMQDFDHSNTGLTILNFNGNGEVLAELLNDTQHLKNE